MLDDDGLAYQFILRGGYNHRGAARVQQYDEWVINEALEREDFATAIKSIGDVEQGIDGTVKQYYYEPLLAKLLKAYLRFTSPDSGIE